MKNEQKNTTLVVADPLENLEKAHQQSIKSVYENMDELLLKAKQVNLTSTSTEQEYEKVRKLWRTIKDTHIAVEQRRKDLKKPIVEYGKRLDAFSKTIYDPLRAAEKSVRDKMRLFEEGVEQKKSESEELIEKQEKQKESLDMKLHELSSISDKIDNSTTLQEVVAIQDELDNIDLKDFGERSDEAGFIVQNLLLKCKDVMNANYDEKDIEAAEKVSHSMESSEAYLKSQGVDVKEYGERGFEEVFEHSRGNDLYAEHGEVLDDTKHEETPSNVESEKEEKKEENLTEENKNIEKLAVEEKPELDFEKVADMSYQTSLLDHIDEVDKDGEDTQLPKKETVKYFSKEEVGYKLGDSVLPMAVFDDIDENKIERVYTVNSLFKHNDADYDKYHGLPSKLTVMVEFANGFTAVGEFEFIGLSSEYNLKPSQSESI